METVIAVVATLVITAIVVYFITTAYHKKVTEMKVGNAEEKAREIIDEAVKTAETKKREAMLEAKEESIRVKNDLDKEVKERRAEIQRSERRIVQKEENLDRKLEAIEKREAGFAAKEEEINKQKAQIAKLNEERLQELERISGLTSEQAKEYLLKTVEEDVKLDTAKLIKEMEHKAKEEADKKAKEYVVTAIQKCAADHVAETTISVVQLPNDEMKGRIIGREGRNIRTLETMTGVDLIIDDTPEAVILSGLLAAEIGVDVRTAKRAGLLHDIGKSVDHDMEGSHIQLGVDLCRKYKESAIVINAVEAHHGDVEPESLIACIVQAADTISAARPGARRETLETYSNRLKQLEDISNGFKGVEKSFAIQAGREIRVMVVPEQVSDADMVLMARDISKKIEAEMEYPGQIKVNVIRESRVTDYAK